MEKLVAALVWGSIMIYSALGVPFDVDNGALPLSHRGLPSSKEGERVRVEVPCKFPFGVYRDPTDCTKYYQCHNGYPFIHHVCPPGTEFSEEFNFCHWAAQVKCSFDPDEDEYEYDELSEVLPIAPVVAEVEVPNILYPNCDCSGDVGDDGRGDCEKNWCYVAGDSSCIDKAPSTYMPGWSWSKYACLGRQRTRGCDCNGRTSAGGHGNHLGSRGECKKNWCYVDPEATCTDTQPSSQIQGWLWSYEACRAPAPPVIAAVHVEIDESGIETQETRRL